MTINLGNQTPQHGITLVSAPSTALAAILVSAFDLVELALRVSTAGEPTGMGYPFRPLADEATLAYQTLEKTGLIHHWVPAEKGKGTKYVCDGSKDCLACNNDERGSGIATNVLTVGSLRYGVPFQPVTFLCARHARETTDWARGATIRIQPELVAIIADALEARDGKPVNPDAEISESAREFIRYSPIRYLTSSERKAEAINFAL